MAEVERRDVLKGAVAVGVGVAALPLLTACGGGGGKASGVTVAKTDVPVGGGVIDGGIVVTQPTAGEFKAFSSTCTHQGCTVTKVEGGFIICPCHQSHYAVATGVPTAAGPATKPLPTKTVTASGDNLVIS